jgi:hypothetical protein
MGKLVTAAPDRNPALNHLLFIVSHLLDDKSIDESSLGTT